MGDFNIDLLKYTTETSPAQFLDQIYLLSVLPQIISVQENSSCISDHVAQFLLFPIEKTKGSKKKEIYKRNFKSLTGNESIEDLKNINWDKGLRLNQNQTDRSFKLFFNIFETPLDTYALLEKSSNSELKLLSKPWITYGIMTSIKNKDKIYKKLLKSKNSQQNERLCNATNSKDIETA